MNDRYTNPLCERYASDEMQKIFSPDTKFRTWRRLWIALAQAQQELGLPIEDEQIEQMQKNVDSIDYERVALYEKELRHDVMAHIRAYGDVCPKAKGIIHWGATSCYVGDNTDLIVMHRALLRIRQQLAVALRALCAFALKTKDIPTLGFTHYQPAQPVTVGKRAALWAHDLFSDLRDVDAFLAQYALRGAKGTTGTQASYMELFDQDEQKVQKLDALVCKKMGFEKTIPITSQTYSRKIDTKICNLLSSIAQSAWKFSNDIRLLHNLQEIEEPFEKSQVGSSAMAYKRNPMRSERMASLARYVVSVALNPALTASTQWFERTLDDSANKRISMPEAFLATDGILSIYHNVASGLVIYPKVILKNLMEQLPFMVTETLLMQAVKKGGDRQELHEKIRSHSMAAAEAVKKHGKKNDLIDRIRSDDAFDLSTEEMDHIMDPMRYVGRSVAQTESFVNEIVLPYISKIDIQEDETELKV